MKKNQLILIVIGIAIAFFSCKSSSLTLFKPTSPREEFTRKLEKAGLDKTAIGADWINAASESMRNAPTIKIPYKETGYFDGSKVSAVAFIFGAIEGQKIRISLTKKPGQTIIYTDLWSLREVNNPDRIAFADTLNNPIQYEIKASGNYLISLQPQLLQSAEYTLEITSGASLAFPTQSKTKTIGSYWGDGRENNTRKHEGIDIFGSFRSPVLAVAEGTVTRVNTNNLGGKVVWLRPKGKQYSLYYAHLDEQTAVEGQIVSIGDTLGLMGNTGNAKTTPTHLHFGIYTPTGATNPLPFINPITKSAVKILGDLVNLNKSLRTITKTKFYAAPENNATIVSDLLLGTIVHINSATGNYYRVELPNGDIGFVHSDKLTQITKPLKKLKIKSTQKNVYSQPNSLSPVKLTLNIGQTVSLLGNFNNFSLISDGQSNQGWVAK